MKQRKFNRIWGEPFDYSYLLELEKYKLVEMYKYFESVDAFVGTEQVVRDMRICIRLIDIILDKDTPYKAWLHTSFGEGRKSAVKFPVPVNVRNHVRFVSSHFFSNSAPFDLLVPEYRKKKALWLYNHIRTERLFNWWV